MFETLYKYYKRSSPEGFIKLPEEVVNKLFGIFEREVFVEGRIKVLLNYLLKGQYLNDAQLLFLVKNAFESEYVLNRLLQYPFANDIILNWVKFYSEDERLSKRRMEVTSWQMDERHYAIPPISVLYNDLRLYFNQLEEGEIYSCIRTLWEKVSGTRWQPTQVMKSGRLIPGLFRCAEKMFMKVCRMKQLVMNTLANLHFMLYSKPDFIILKRVFLNLLICTRAA